MDTNSAFGFMDLLVCAGGVYVLYAYYLLVTKGEIKQGVIVSKNTNPKKCKDLEGFKKYIGVRTLIFGLITFAAGAIGLYQDYVQRLSTVIYWVMLGFFLAAVVWYAYCSKKAEKEYF